MVRRAYSHPELFCTQAGRLVLYAWLCCLQQALDSGGSPIYDVVGFPGTVFQGLAGATAGFASFLCACSACLASDCTEHRRSVLLHLHILSIQAVLPSGLGMGTLHHPMLNNSSCAANCEA